MFSKNDERAHPSAAGGWDQPRQWSRGTRLVIGTLLCVLVVAIFCGIIIWVGANSDKLDEIESSAAILLS